MSVPAESILFDLWSATYDRPELQYSTYRPVHDAVLARLAGLTPSMILDLGCGTGQLTRRLRHEYPDAVVIGADLSTGMLHRAASSHAVSGYPDTVPADRLADQLADRLAGHLAGERGADADGDADGEGNGDDARRGHRGSIAFVQADAQRLPIASGNIDVVVCTESFHWYQDQAAAVAEIHRVLTPGGRLVIASVATVTGVADVAIQRVTAAAGRPIKVIPKRRLRQLLEAGGFEVTHQGRIPRLGLVPWPLLSDAVRR